MFAIIVFILILLVLVMIHEFGHFIAAKRAGIGVEEFGFGLPPRIWGKKYKGTIYSINWLPLGGFVRLVGEDETGPFDKDKYGKDKSNNFAYKSLVSRMVVVLAGVFMNLALAVVIFYIVLWASGFKVIVPSLVDHKFKFVNQSTKVLVYPSAGSLAEAAGIKPGDAIIVADGLSIKSSDDLQKAIRSNENKDISLTLEDLVSNKQRRVNLSPKYDENLKAAAIGVGINEFVSLNYETLPQKVFSGFAHSYNTTEYSLKVFGGFIGYAVTHRDLRPVSDNVSGPIGIAQIISQVTALGFIPTLSLVGLLSLNLAIMNVLPIPALDGGRFFFLIIEAIIGRRVYPQLEKWVHSIGFALLIGLFILISYNDILKLAR